MVAGTAHYFAAWQPFGFAMTRCGVTIQPRQPDFREPRPSERECRRCTDWKETP
jgi:hypothetical protein